MTVLKLLLALFATFAVLGTVHDAFGVKSAMSRALQSRRLGAFPIDLVICPTVSAMINSGLLPVTPEGVISAPDMKAAMFAIGMDPGFICAFFGPNDKIIGVFDYLNVLEMDGHPMLEHKLSTGIRDPVVDASLWPEWEKYADADGMFGIGEIMQVAAYFDENSNDFNPHHFVDSAFILPIQMMVLTQDPTLSTKMSAAEWKAFMLEHTLPPQTMIKTGYEWFSCGGQAIAPEWEHMHD